MHRWTGKWRFDLDAYLGDGEVRVVHQQVQQKGQQEVGPFVQQDVGLGHSLTASQRCPAPPPSHTLSTESHRLQRCTVRRFRNCSSSN